MSMWYWYSIIIYIEGWYLASVWVCDGIMIYGIMIYGIIIYIEGWYIASVWVCYGIMIYGIIIYIEGLCYDIYI